METKNNQEVQLEDRAAQIPVNTIVIHLYMMVFGYICYWVVAMAMPTKWWFTNKGWFWWAVPYFGYYAYCPRDLKWWQPPNAAV